MSYRRTGCFLTFEGNQKRASVELKLSSSTIEKSFEKWEDPSCINCAHAKPIFTQIKGGVFKVLSCSDPLRSGEKVVEPNYLCVKKNKEEWEFAQS